MDDRRLEDKLDKVIDKISNIDVTLASQAKDLSEHIRRTELLEQQIKPLDKHVTMVNGVVRFIGFLTLAVGLVAGVIQLFGKH